MSGKKYYISPLYQVMEEIECFILENDLKSHDKLPGERKLCEMFECSRVTLRSAFECLENAGITYSIRGMGNYVAEKKIEICLVRYDSFFEQLRDLDQKPVLEILSVKKIGASDKTARHLEVPAGSEVWETKTLITVGDIPVILETGRISAERFPLIGQSELEKREIYQVFQDIYGTRLEYGDEEISITNAQEEEAEYLEIDDNIPAFYVKKTGGSLEMPVIFSQAVIRADKIQFASILK